MLRGLALVTLAAVIAVPAALARPATGVKLFLLPLPKSALGPAKSLPLERDSGSVGNYAAVRRALGGASMSTFVNLGRLSGYALDYGIGASGGSGVTEVRTSVDQYITTKGAKRGLRFWKHDDPRVTQLDQGGFGVTSKALRLPAVGSSRFAFAVTFRAGNITPLFSVDEQFTEGDYEADVTVWAGTAAGAKELAPKLAQALDARIKEALAGKLHAKPVKLPAKQVAGPPVGGPDLAQLALKASDLGSSTVSSQSYARDPLALSDYSLLMAPAGPFVLLDQEIEWYATANQAAFEADYAIASTSGKGTSPVDLSSVGDGAQGVVIAPPTGNFGLVVLSTGKLAEFIVAGAQSAVQPSDLQNVAQKAANYINAAGLGS